MTAKREKSERMKYIDKQHKLRMSVRELLNGNSGSMSFGVDSLIACQVGKRKKKANKNSLNTSGRN